MRFISFYDLVIILKEPVIAQDSRRFLSVGEQGLLRNSFDIHCGKAFFVDTHVYLHFCGVVSDEFSYFKLLILQNLHQVVKRPCLSSVGLGHNPWAFADKLQKHERHFLIPVVQFPPETTENKLFRIVSHLNLWDTIYDIVIFLNSPWFIMTHL